MKTARGLGLLRGFGGFLRDIFKQRGWYEDRRSLQMAASIAIAVLVIAIIVWGLLWAWHYIKRYRLAIGFMGLTLGGIIGGLIGGKLDGGFGIWSILLGLFVGPFLGIWAGYKLGQAYE